MNVLNVMIVLLNVLNIFRIYLKKKKCFYYYCISTVSFEKYQYNFNQTNSKDYFL